MDEVGTQLQRGHPEPGQRKPSADLSTKAAQQGDSWTLSGRKNPVLAGDCADTLVVSAGLPDGGTGLFLVDAASVTRHPFRTFDGHVFWSLGRGDRVVGALDRRGLRLVACQRTH